MTNIFLEKWRGLIQYNSSHFSSLDLTFLQQLNFLKTTCTKNAFTHLCKTTKIEHLFLKCPRQTLNICIWSTYWHSHYPWYTHFPSQNKEGGFWYNYSITALINRWFLLWETESHWNFSQPYHCITLLNGKVTMRGLV